MDYLHDDLLLRIGKDSIEDVAEFVNIDIGYYFGSYPDVAAAQMDPLQHFILFGQFENRCIGLLEIDDYRVSSGIDWDKYVDSYADVKNSVDTDPVFSEVEHYIKYGKLEQRAIFFTKEQEELKKLFWEMLAGSSCLTEIEKKEFLDNELSQISDSFLLFVLNFFTDKRNMLHVGCDILLTLNKIALWLDRPLRASYFTQLYSFGCPWTFPHREKYDHILTYPLVTLKEYCDYKSIHCAVLYESQSYDQPLIEFLGESASSNVNDKFTLPPVYAAELKNVTVFQKSSAVLASDNICIYDEARSSRTFRDASSSCSHCMGIGKNYISFFVFKNIEEFGNSFYFHALLSEYFNYFHSLVHLVPKLLLFSEKYPNVKPVCLVADDLPSSIISCIVDILGFTERKIHHNYSYRIPNICLVSEIHHVIQRRNHVPEVFDEVYNENALKLLKNLFERSTQNNGPNVNLYIDSSFRRYRHMVNEDQLVELANFFGYTSYSPQQDNFFKQVETFKSCNQILCQSSAALANILFCKKNTVIVVLTNNAIYNNYTCFASLARISGAKLYYCRCTPIKSPDSEKHVSQSDFYIEIEELLKRFLLLQKTLPYGISEMIPRSDPCEFSTKLGSFLGKDSLKQVVDLVRLDSSYYFDTYPNVRNDGVNPWTDFLMKGRFEGKSARPFSKDQFVKACGIEWDKYLRSNYDIAQAKSYNPGFDYIDHFCRTRFSEGRHATVDLNNDRSLLVFFEFVFPRNSPELIRQQPHTYLIAQLASVSDEHLAEAIDYFLLSDNMPPFGSKTLYYLHRIALWLNRPITAEYFYHYHSYSSAWCFPGYCNGSYPAVFPLRSLVDYCTEHNIATDILVSERTFTPPPLFFDNELPVYCDDMLHLPPVVAATLDNVTVNYETRGIISEDYYYIDDRFANLKGDRELFVTNFLLIGFGEKFISLSIRASQFPLESGIYYSLLPESDPNYFHWISETIPKAIFAAEECPSGQSCSVLIRNDLHKSLYELVNMVSKRFDFNYLAPGQTVTVKKFRAISECHQVAVRNAPPKLGDQVYCEKTLKRIRRILLDSYDTIPAWRNTLVLRSGNSFRFLINSKAVHNFIQSQGFAPFVPQGGNLREQIKVFSESSIIIGESGSSMANIIFCQPGATVYILTNANECNEYSCFAAMARAFDLKLKYLRGVQVQDSHEFRTQSDYIYPLESLYTFFKNIKLQNFDEISEDSHCVFLENTAQKIIKMFSDFYLKNDYNACLELAFAAGLSFFEVTSFKKMQLFFPKIDYSVRAVGKSVLKSLKIPFKSQAKITKKNKFCYIATNVSDYGGHTLIILDIMKCFPEAEHHLILTNIDNKIPSSLNREIVRLFPICHSISGSDYAEKLQSSFNIIDSIQPDFLFHVAHPYDSLALASMQSEITSKQIFLNHADHSYSMIPRNPSISYVRFFDNVSSSGVCRMNNQFLVRATAVDPFAGSKFSPFLINKHSEFITATSGTSTKFNDRFGHETYLALLRARFECLPGSHVHIGNLSQETIEMFYKNFSKEQLIHIPFAGSLSKTLAALNPNLYISSFPTGGGKAAVEAMAAGCASASFLKDGITDCSKIFYPEHISFSSIRDFAIKISSFTEKDEIYHKKNSRSHYTKYHSNDQWEKSLREILGK